MGKESKKPAKAKDEDLELEDEDLEDEDAEEGEETEEAPDEAEADEDDDKPAKPKKGVVPKGLVPREPVKVPTAVLKAQTKEIRELLKQRDDLQSKGDKKGLRKVRAALRKQGFRLSNLEGGSLKKKEEAVESEE